MSNFTRYRWIGKIEDINSPYNFDLSIRAISTPISPAVYQGGAYIRALTIENKETVIKLRSSGSTNEPSIEIEVLFEEKYDEEDIENVLNIIDWMFDLRMDLKPFYNHIKKNDSKLYEVIKKLNGLKIITEPTPYEVLIKCICFQMVSFPVAMRIVENFVKTLGHQSKINPKLYLFPEPYDILTGIKKYKNMLKLSKQKTESIIEIAKRAIIGKLELDTVKTKPNSDIINDLCKIKGIGRWTAELFLIWGLKRYNALPADDKAGRRVLKEFYGKDEMDKPDCVRRYSANKWNGYGGIAMYYLMSYFNLGDYKLK
jgi:DNA-3-methyladenine glycosylase II